MDQVIYNNDTRYPGPSVHPPPSYIHGIPTRAELDAYPRMFTWGELKEIVQTGELERLMRNKAMQARYDEWMVGIKVQYGSTERYLTRARLPWSSSTTADPAGTYDLSNSPTTTHTSTLPVDLVPSTNPSAVVPIQTEVESASHAATPGGRGAPSVSGTATPSSAGFVSLASLKIVNGRLRSASGSNSKRKSDISAIVGSESGVSTPKDVRSNTASAGNSPSIKASHDETTVQALQSTMGSLQLDSDGAKDGSSSASLTVAAPATANGIQVESVGNGNEVENEHDDEDDEDDGEPPVYLKWDHQNRLDGEKYAVLPNDWPYNVPYGVRHYCVWSRVPIAHPELVEYDPESWARIEVEGLGGFSGTTPLREFHIPSPSSSSPPSVASPTSPHHDTPSATSDISHQGKEGTPKKDSVLFTKEMVSQTKLIGRLQERDWYAADVAYAGEEMRKWAGVTYESKGGQEVGKMVRGLWDPKGWECLWFVNPPRLQSVPGFSHFHVFARRKTPEEIDASEAFY